MSIIDDKRDFLNNKAPGRKRKINSVNKPNFERDSLH